MSTSSTAEEILSIYRIYSIYASLFILFFGLIGNILNLLVLTTLKMFRNNPYAFYLIIEAIANVMLLLILLTSRMLMDAFAIDFTQSSLAWCKIRAALAQGFTIFYFTTNCFSTFGQFLSTSNRPYLRQMSTLKLAHRLTCLNLCFVILHGIPFLTFFNIEASVGCTPDNPGFVYYYSFVYYSVLIGLLPIFVMVLFSILAFYNVRHINRRQISVVRRRLDRQLTSMILARVIVITVCSLPYVIYRIFILNNSINRSNSIQLAINQCIQSVLVLLFYVNYAGGFYVYMISSSRFRRQVKYCLMRKYCRSFKRLFTRKSSRVSQNQISPVKIVSSAHSHEMD